MKILKYEVVHEVQMPEDAFILDIQYQNDILVMWAEVKKEVPVVTRYFDIIGTGWEVDSDTDRAHLATVQHGIYVWHIFEVFKDD